MAHTCHYYNAQSILSVCQCIYSQIHTYVYTCMFARIWAWSPSSQNALWMAPPTQKAWSFHQATPARTGEFYIMHYMQAGWQCLIGIWDQHQIPYNVGHLIGEIRLVNIVKLNIQAIYTQTFVWLACGWALVQAVLMSHLALSLHFFSTCTADENITCVVSVCGKKWAVWIAAL